MTEENHEKTPVRLVYTGIQTRDLPNASLVRYHGATSLDKHDLYIRLLQNLHIITINKIIFENIKFLMFVLINNKNINSNNII